MKLAGTACDRASDRGTDRSTDDGSRGGIVVIAPTRGCTANCRAGYSTSDRPGRRIPELIAGDPVIAGIAEADGVVWVA